MVPGGSDQGFCNALIRAHTGHRRFDVIKTKPTWFIVKHFAGPVSYCSDTFLDKNKDQLSVDCVQAMKASTNNYIASLFKDDPKYADPEEGGGGGGKKKKS